MQLGTRWAVGSDAPAGLPDVVLHAIGAVEEELDALDVDASSWRWTLTWLERKPVVELDDGTVIRYHPDEDSATITQTPSDAFDQDDAD